MTVVLGGNNNGVWDGTFTTAQKINVDLGPTGIDTGDFDSNGAQDLAVTCGVANKLHVIYGYGDGTFSSGFNRTTGDNPMFVTVDDLDAIGNDDILVCNQFSDDISVWIGNGDGTFEVRDDYAAENGARSAVAALVNDDPIPDLFVSNWQDDSISLFMGETTAPGHFVLLDSFDSGDAPSKPGVTDLNGDGIVDVVVASRGLDSIAVMLGYCDEDDNTK